MYKPVSKLLSFFILLHFSASCSGTHVGFSIDARRNNPISSPIDTISFLRKNNVSPTQIKVFVTGDSVLDTIATTGVLVDLFLDVENLRKSNDSVTSWLKIHLGPHLKYINFSSIVLSSNSSSSSSVLATLKLIHSALESLDLSDKVKVSVAFPLSTFKHSHSQRWHAVIDFVRKSKSFIMLETKINGELSMGDHFVGLMINSAISSAKLVHYKDVPIVLNVKSSVVPSAIEVVEFSKRMCVGFHEHISHRIAWVYAQISPMEEGEQKELNREEEQIFRSSHRELLDEFDPPSPVPVPEIVTVPATNPVTITPVNPSTNPIAVPATTPMTIPPVTPPAAPVGNQAPPVLTSPMPPTGGFPMTPPLETPVGNPVTVTPPAGTNPSTSGQVWCVAKTGATQTALQVALDYACGMGGADCSAIQQSGNCYNPNTPQNHASYAFNSYYQKHPAPSSCDFKGAATLVNTNPSTGSCIYPSSSSTTTSLPPPSLSAPSLPPPSQTTPLLPPPSLAAPFLPPPSVSPPETTTASSPPLATTVTSPPATTGSNVPPFLLNSTYPDSSAPGIYGSSPPPASSTSISVATGLQPLLTSFVLIPFIVAGNLCRA